LSEIEIEAKYAGFIERQNREARRLEKHLEKKLPANVNWRQLKSLSRETVDKLVRYRPPTIGRALGVGVSPSDALVILAMLRSGKLRALVQPERAPRGE